jgi:hypothetical protein
MNTPSNEELERQFGNRPLDLPAEVLARVREHSKRMFGNQDRLEVAVAVARVALGRVNATDLSRDVALAVNRVRAQLLALEALGLLTTVPTDDGRRVFLRVDDTDRFWSFVVDEFDDVIGGKRSR